ncbi:insulinase family protein [candidate division KSB1 bacterium]|nr:insulinase family protein [candidate division KSB1 bacterium]
MPKSLTDNHSDTTAFLRDKFFEHNPVRSHRLSNGLKVLTYENHSLPVVSMYTFYSVGSRNERPGITGISHLLEHMMFNGSKKFGPKEFDRILESGGGHSNAYTSRDLTVYYEDFTSHLLETVIELDSDRMGWLSLSEEILSSESDVVKEERRMRTDNSVYGRLEEELYSASFQCHPYRWPIIGWMSDIENISLSDCREYYKKYYAPNNAILVLAGDFQRDDALKIIEKHYGNIPAGTAPDTPSTIEPPQNGEKRIKFKKKAEMDNFVVGYHAPAIGHKDLYVFDVIQTILSDGESSILHNIMVRTKEMAAYVDSYFTWHINPGLFEIVVQMNPGYSSLDGEKFLDKVLAELSGRKLKQKDVNRAVNILEIDFIKGFQTNNGCAHSLGLWEVLFGDYSKLTNVLEEYRNVTLEDVIRVFSEYFTPDKKTVVWLDIESDSS